VIETKRLVIAGVLVILLVGGYLGYSRSSDSGLPGCVAGENEICPSQQWSKALKKYQELGAALNAAVPGGYSPNQAGTKFIKNVTVVQPAPEKKP
jgi:hypothetical protein